MIAARDLSKSYGTLRAVDSLSLNIEKGETFGLLGPNGAGKTTTISMLVGLLTPDSGTVRIDGDRDPGEPDTRRSIGIAPQALAIYEELTGEENVRFFGQLYDLAGAKLTERTNWALDFVGLTPRRADRAKTYSGGMQRRLNIACAVVHDPQIILFDEPTVGVDPQSRNQIFDTIEALAREGRTILYTTHYMEEAERLCDRVGIMDNGKLLALDTVDALITQHGGDSVVEVKFEGTSPTGMKLPPPEKDGSVLIHSARPFDVVSQFASAGSKVEGLAIRRPTLEDVFLNLTGRSLRD